MQHRLSRDQVIWSFGPDLEPVLEVEPGDTVVFETNDCFTGQIRSEDDLVTEIDMSRINSATGPVAVRGAEPGDSLVAEILDVSPIEWGVATLIPGFGQLIDQVRSPVTRLFEVRDGTIRMNDRVTFPARPMVGVVGVATDGEELSNGLAGRHGFEIWAPDGTPASRDRLETLEQLRTALDTDELDVHYQPKLQLRSGRVIGVVTQRRFLGAVQLNQLRQAVGQLALELVDTVA